MNQEFHIHANHFGQKAPKCIDQLTLLGFKPKLASIHLRGDWEPFWLITYRGISFKDTNKVYLKALTIMQADASYNGYIELETVPQNWHIELDESEQIAYRSVAPFFKTNAVDLPKKADVHVSRKISFEETELDIFLEGLGFYPVRTSTNVIWTLLAADLKDVAANIEKLKSYFKACGGVREIECEIVSRMDYVPENFKRPLTWRIRNTQK